jgi:predicted small secreted protein
MFRALLLACLTLAACASTTPGTGAPYASADGAASADAAPAGKPETPAAQVPALCKEGCKLCGGCVRNDVGNNCHAVSDADCAKADCCVNTAPGAAGSCKVHPIAKLCGTKQDAQDACAPGTSPRDGKCEPD